MARMVPDQPPDTPSRAEEKLYLRLREQLPDEFIVYHSVVYRLADGRDKDRQGEADFVVLHPQFGLLVIEVKGGGLTWDRKANCWFSEGRQGRHKICDPFKQVQRHVRDLRSLLGKVPAAQGHGIRFAWAVALPDCRADQVGLAGADARRLIDVRALNDLSKRIDEICQQAGKLQEPIPRKVMRAIEQQVLARYYRLVPTLSSQLEWERQSLALLTEPQSLCLDFLELNPRCLVHGPAGTGKTVVAVEYARRLAAAGHRVALVCYNRPLARHLQAAVQADVCSDSILAGTFHEICEYVIRQANLPWEVPEDEGRRQQFWDEQTPLLLVEALEKLPDRRFDHLVIDEGQDMNPDWWEALCGLLEHPNRGGIVIFCDPRQNIYRRKEAYPVPSPVFPLRVNCRNTRAIADFCCDLIGETEHVPVLSPSGEEPVIRRYGNAEEQRRKIERDLRRLLEQEDVAPEQIVILGPHRFVNSSLANVERLAEVRLIAEDSEPTAECIRYSTLHRFKGLEADIVLLCDIDGDPKTCSPEHVYVAASRARHRLFIYATEGVELKHTDESPAP